MIPVVLSMAADFTSMGLDVLHERRVLDLGDRRAGQKGRDDQDGDDRHDQQAEHPFPALVARRRSLPVRRRAAGRAWRLTARTTVGERRTHFSMVRVLTPDHARSEAV